MPDPTAAQASGAADDRMRFWLSVAIVAGFLAFITLVALKPAQLPGDTLGIIVGAWIMMLKDVSGYFFGSSSGSKMKSILANPENQVTLTAPAASGTTTTTVLRTDSKEEGKNERPTETTN